MTGFALRAPWYVRERAEMTPLDPAMLRPAIQMYDDTNFVRRITADPRDSLAFDEQFDDVWSYPVPVKPTGIGRGRLTTWAFVTTTLRKLYQPSHNRFYAVVVEVFCDQPGLPRAGKHDEIEVGFVMRRQHTTLTGPRGPQRHIARQLMKRLAAEQQVPLDETVEGLRDVRDLWWADRAAHERTSELMADDLAQLDVDVREQGWFTRGENGSEGGWHPLELDDTELVEQKFPMFRLPAREEDCGPARTRSTWFGVIPTYSGDHSIVGGKPRPKYDSQAIYEIRCFVRKKQQRGHEHCPPQVWWSDLASEPFRLADPMDPQGTSKRVTSITLPDLRRLAARAGRPMGPGGVAITTPPKSQFVFDPFGPLDGSKKGATGDGGGVCMFALELFFLVAFFLFLAFLPIVVLMFQLWWLLALRFCIPPSLGLSIAAEFFARGKLLADFRIDADVKAKLSVRGLTPDEAIDQIFGTDSTAPDAVPGAWSAKIGATLEVANDSGLTHALVTAGDPAAAVQPIPPALETRPDDPLCPPRGVAPTQGRAG